MPDDNPTPAQRQQNKINTERALRDNGVRLGDLRASMVAQQQQIRETGLRTGSLTTTGLETGSLRTGSLGASFPAKPFTPAQQGGDGQPSQSQDDKIGDFIIIRIDPDDAIARGFSQCRLSVELGPEIT